MYGRTHNQFPLTFYYYHNCRITFFEITYKLQKHIYLLTYVGRNYIKLLLVEKSS